MTMSLKSSLKETSKNEERYIEVQYMSFNEFRTMFKKYGPERMTFDGFQLAELFKINKGETDSAYDRYDARKNQLRRSRPTSQYDDDEPEEYSVSYFFMSEEGFFIAAYMRESYYKGHSSVNHGPMFVVDADAHFLDEDDLPFDWKDRAIEINL